MQTMHLLPGVAIQPNLELKTQPKLVLGSLPLAFALPVRVHECGHALCLREKKRKRGGGGVREKEREGEKELKMRACFMLARVRTPGERDN